ncbi:MAG: hypothetical protein JEZ04_04750 [Spirochaetales bacterium]|nr:hypothetical protein [Spirochaetales bacterium]
MLKRYIYNLPFIIIFILCCTIPFFFNGTSGSGRIWEDYYLVGIPEGGCPEVLETGYFSGLETVSAYNTVFSFNDFDEMNTIMLNDIDGRFIEGDPRVDPLMKTAGRYFHTESSEGVSFELVYVKSRSPSMRFYFNTMLSYGKQVSTWIFPDFNIWYRLAAVLLFAVCWFFGIRMLSGMRFMAFLAGIPWMAVIILSSPDMLSSSVLGYIIFIMTVQEIYPDLIFYLNYQEIRISRSSLFFIAGFLIATIASAAGQVVNGIILPPFLTSVAAELILAAIYYSLKSEKVRRQEHRLFFPIKIFDDRLSGNDNRKIPVYTAAAVAVILLPLFVMFITEDALAPIPVPHQSGAIESWSWMNLEYLDQAAGGLPSAADILKHEAFQQGYMYGRDYSFPSKGEKLTVGRYVTENNGVVYREICIQEFTDDWYASIIDRGNGTGLNKLLLSRQMPTAVSLKTSFNVVPGYSPLGHIIISLSALLPIFGLFLSKTSITVRRKGQEA